MNRIYLSTVVCLFIASACTAAAQHGRQIQVLQLPQEARNQSRQPADHVVSIHYGGKLSASRKISVRIFHEPLSDLIDKMPRQTPRGQCVVYNQGAVYPVDHGFDRELRIGDLEYFFSAYPFQYKQTLTLVFEEGDDPSSSGPLYLEKSAVQSYFANAVELTLDATENIKAGWKQDAARELATSHPPSPGFFGKLFGASPVAAAVTNKSYEPAPPPPAAQPVHLEPDCQRVKLIPYSAQADNTTATDGALEALAPVAMRESVTCGE
jgi:hypothetical protein